MWFVDLNFVCFASHHCNRCRVVCSVQQFNLPRPLTVYDNAHLQDFIPHWILMSCSSHSICATFHIFCIQDCQSNVWRPARWNSSASVSAVAGATAETTTARAASTQCQDIKTGLRFRHTSFLIWCHWWFGPEGQAICSKLACQFCRKVEPFWSGSVIEWSPNSAWLDATQYTHSSVPFTITKGSALEGSLLAWAASHTPFLALARNQLNAGVSCLG